MDTAIIAGLFGILIGLLPKIWDWISGGRQASFINDANDIVTMMREQSTDFKAEISVLRVEVANLKALVTAFESELITLGVDRTRIEVIKRGISGV